MSLLDDAMETMESWLKLQDSDRRKFKMAIVNLALRQGTAVPDEALQDYADPKRRKKVKA